MRIGHVKLFLLCLFAFLGYSMFFGQDQASAYTLTNSANGGGASSFSGLVVYMRDGRTNATKSGVRIDITAGSPGNTYSAYGSSKSCSDASIINRTPSPDVFYGSDWAQSDSSGNVELGDGENADSDPGSPNMWGDGYAGCSCGALQVTLGTSPDGGFWDLNDNGVKDGSESGSNTIWLTLSNGYKYDLVVHWQPNPTTGNVVGRIFVDNNGNGSFDSGDQFVQNGVNCGSFANLSATVTVSEAGTSPPNLCNPEPHYSITAPGGARSVSVNRPSGYMSTTTNPVNVTVPNGGTVDVWFGIRLSSPPNTPTVSTQCSGSNSQVRISWTGGDGSSGFNVDLDRNTSDSDGYWYKSGATSPIVLPTSGMGIVGSEGSPPSSTLVVGNTYRTKIYSNATTTSSAWVSFTAVSCSIPAPTLSTSCSSGVAIISVSWTNRGSANHIVDIDDASDFSSGSNKGVGSGTSTNAPNGFSPSITLVSGRTYYVRVYYNSDGLRTATASAVAPSCVSDTGPPTFTLTVNCNTITITSLTDPDNAGNIPITISIDGSQIDSRSTTGTYSVNVPAGKRDPASHPVSVTATGLKSDGTPGTATTKTDTIGPCYNSTCSTMSINNGNPVEANVSFPVSVTFNNSGSTTWAANTPDPVVRLAITNSTTGTVDNSDVWSLAPAGSVATGANGKPHVKLAANVAGGANVTLTFNAKTNTPNAVDNNQFYPRLVYENGSTTTFFGGACSNGTFDSTKKFTISAAATNLDLTPNDEEPSGATATYSVTVSGAGASSAVATRTNRIFKRVGGVDNPIYDTVTATNEAQTPSPRTVTHTKNPGVTGVTPGQNVCGSISISPSIGYVKANNSIVSASGTESKEICTTVGYKPYFRLYNSDLAVGFGAGCPAWFPSGNSKLTGWNDGTGKGAGVQMAALVLGEINQVTSATGRSSTPQPPKDLTLANTVAADAYGGNFGGPGFCPPDYFASAPAGNTRSPGTIQTSSLSAGAAERVATGNVTLESSAPISGNITLYVDGNVYISQNITYASSWTIDNVPKFSLVVKGNIQVGNGVTNLDGVYIAQPVNASNGGRIYTCATGLNAIPAAAALYANCNSKLTINGLFIAKQVKLLRTNGSFSKPGSGNTEAANSANIAESFILSPEMWMVKPGGILAPGANGTYDTVDNPPPVL